MCKAASLVSVLDDFGFSVLQYCHAIRRMVALWSTPPPFPGTLCHSPPSPQHLLPPPLHPPYPLPLPRQWYEALQPFGAL